MIEKPLANSNIITGLFDRYAVIVVKKVLVDAEYSRNRPSNKIQLHLGFPEDGLNYRSLEFKDPVYPDDFIYRIQNEKFSLIQFEVGDTKKRKRDIMLIVPVVSDSEAVARIKELWENQVIYDNYQYLTLNEKGELTFTKLFCREPRFNWLQYKVAAKEIIVKGEYSWSKE